MDRIIKVEEAKILNLIAKLSMYKKEEDLLYESLKESLKNFLVNYQTGNLKQLKEKNMDLVKNLKITLINHNNNLTVLEKRVIIAQHTIAKNVSNLKKIGD